MLVLCILAISAEKSKCKSVALSSEIGTVLRINVWIYGHSHTNIDAEIGGTRIICNQMGYVFEDGYRMNGFDPGKFFEIV